MSDKPTIDCAPNGPYLVKGLARLTNSRGEELTAAPAIALCRCGGSANKPFCDGTHKRNGFTDARLSDGSSDRRDDYRGRRITVHDNRGICAHAGHCTDGLPAVFKYGAEPWIDADGADVDAIIAAVRKCPSGALSYSVDGADPAAAPRPPAIAITKDGPYAVTGAIPIAGQPGRESAAADRVTLCRCGASKNKPYCDGSHWSSGFADERN